MILQKIVARKKEEVAQLRRHGIRLPEEYSNQQVAPPRDFRQALVDYRNISIIAEVKKASPSKGVICEDFDPVRIACNYQKNGAQAISVLTDVDFFQGNLHYLMQVREAIDLPVLRKDFIIDQLQIEEAALHGADAILLIAAILDQKQIEDFAQAAAAMQMDVLVEVHDEEELDKALGARPDLIGINNRNLNDFSVDINTTLRLNQLIPAHIPVISESGLTSAADLKTLQDSGICGALIGESLMRAGHDSEMLKMLRS